MNKNDNSAIGIIGIGDLAMHLVKGFKQVTNELEIYIYPRSLHNANILAADYGCKLVKSRDELLEKVKTVFLLVRPFQVREALSGLNFQPQHLLVSGVGGVSIEELTGAISGSPNIVRFMPVVSIEVNSGAIPVYPRDELACEILSLLGDVFEVSSEQELESATAAACMHGWFYAVFQTLADSLIDSGVDGDLAKKLVLLNIRGAVDYCLDKPEIDFAGVAKYIAKEGSYTAAGLDLLNENKVMPHFQAAMEHILKLLHGKQDDLDIPQNN